MTCLHLIAKRNIQLKNNFTNVLFLGCTVVFTNYQAFVKKRQAFSESQGLKKDTILFPLCFLFNQEFKLKSFHSQSPEREHKGNEIPNTRWPFHCKISIILLLSFVTARYVSGTIMTIILLSLNNEKCAECKLSVQTVWPQLSSVTGFSQ